VLVVGAHLLFSAVVAAAFSAAFGINARAAAAHVLLLASWDFALLASVTALALPRQTFRIVLALTCTLQVYLYVLNIVSYESWDRSMTVHLVTAFWPTAWSGREASFPVGKIGISAFFVVPLVLVAGAFWKWGRGIDAEVDVWSTRSRRARIAGLAVVLLAVFGTTLRAGVAGRDNLYFKQELLSSFFRPEGFAFEPTARRHAVAARDAGLRAAYPHAIAGARRKNVVLVIVDSLRADRMQVYGYPRSTTPFLSAMVSSGRMQQVRDAFATCSESFCGITSTLASREFQDISADTFNVQDVLRDQGYDVHFLLSGNHRAWNGLPRFYHLRDGEMFDGSQTERYTMDDDRLVLEGLERIPAFVPEREASAERASAERPSFFYIHLMSTHYLGVQFPESHVFTSADDRVSPGLEPYKILEKLNKPDRYDDKVLQADGVIHRLFDALSAKHYLDDAIVVITGDHGEGLGERHWAHGWHLYNEDIRIPLLIYDQERGPSGERALYPDLTFGVQVDIAPTILDRLGLPVPASWAGESLLHPSPQRFTRHQTYFVPNRFAVLYRDGASLFKFIATPQYGKEELFDLRQDLHEHHDLASEKRSLDSQLRGRLPPF
jgi:glucan phosphoethanolaminetransferase (alkaline phosphatase superfamily)